MIRRRSLLGGATALALAPAGLSIARAHRRRRASPIPRSSSATHTPIAARPRPTPSSAKAETAMFQKINDQGGINGRKLNFLSYDDGYSPPKTVEQTRRLVEQDGVAFLFNPLGTASNTAIWKYCNQKKVPQLFVSQRRRQMGRLQGASLDDRLGAELSDGGADLCQVHPANQARTARSACSIRTTISARTTTPGCGHSGRPIRQGGYRCYL